MSTKITAKQKAAYEQRWANLVSDWERIEQEAHELGEKWRVFARRLMAFADDRGYLAFGCVSMRAFLQDRKEKGETVSAAWHYLRAAKCEQRLLEGFDRKLIEGTSFNAMRRLAGIEEQSTLETVFGDACDLAAKDGLDGPTLRHINSAVHRYRVSLPPDVSRCINYVYDVAANCSRRMDDCVRAGFNGDEVRDVQQHLNAIQGVLTEMARRCNVEIKPP